MVLQELAVPAQAVNIKNPSSLIKSLPRAFLNKVMLGGRVGIGLIALFVGLMIVFGLVGAVIPENVPFIGKAAEKAKSFLGV